MIKINQLKLKDKIIIFDRPIRICIESRGITFVLVETNDNLVFPNRNFKVEKYRNVLAFNSNGDFLWAIEQAPKIFEFEVHYPYSGLFFENDQLIAYHMSGVNYIVDQIDGSIKPRDNGRPW